MKFLLIPLVVLAGMGLAIQTAANTRLGDGLKSPTTAGVFSFLVGGTVMLVLALFGVLGRAQFSGASSIPWWAWVGGALGAFSVIMSILGLKSGGAGVVIAATVFGQLTMGLVLDHFGWLGVEKSPLNGWRVAGGILLLVGAILIGKK